jgi:predicted Co/Zn/Cd cation transporter (cation efflux family)
MENKKLNDLHPASQFSMMIFITFIYAWHIITTPLFFYFAYANGVSLFGAVFLLLGIRNILLVAVKKIYNPKKTFNKILSAWK